MTHTHVPRRGKASFRVTRNQASAKLPSGDAVGGRRFGPFAIGTITLKCLQKEPIKRYQSAAELASESNLSSRLSAERTVLPQLEHQESYSCDPRWIEWTRMQPSRRAKGIYSSIV